MVFGVLIYTLIILIISLCVSYYNDLTKNSPAPALNLEEYWGPGPASAYKENTAILPYDISVPPAIIDDLKEQLKRPLKLVEPLEGVNFEYGFNSKYLQKIIKYWRGDYLEKWSKHEEYLKKLPHYQTQIQGLKIHYLHVKSTEREGKVIVPLLLLRGWPGSVREFYDIIPLLTTSNAENDFIFEVIAPSLPGYGWSQVRNVPGSSKKNLGPTKVAVIMRNLMLRLGHQKFFIHGGDWGAVIGSHMAALFPQHVYGYHSTMCTSSLFSVKPFIAHFMPGLFYDENELQFITPLSELLKILLRETGYMHIQATKPDTIGLALSHNPVGLAAYILEKFSTWTNMSNIHLYDGGLTNDYTLDALLDNIMIYYVTNSITTSCRLYADHFASNERALQMDHVPITVPTGCAHYKYELLHQCNSQLKQRFHNLIHSTYYHNGGHFVAMELPNLLYADFMKFVNKVYKNDQLSPI